MHKHGNVFIASPSKTASNNIMSRHILRPAGSLGCLGAKMTLVSSVPLVQMGGEQLADAVICRQAQQVLLSANADGQGGRALWSVFPGRLAEAEKGGG